MDPSFLPTVNATLNALAMGLLLRGRALARAGRREAHRRVMLAAFGASTLFLVLYAVHKASRGFEDTPYGGEGLLRALYLAILATHVVLAMAVPVLAVVLIALGLRGRIDRHRRLARVAWPIWMYVSVTGVVIYVMLYHANPEPVHPGPSAPAVEPAARVSRPAPLRRVGLGARASPGDEAPERLRSSALLP